MQAYRQSFSNIFIPYRNQIPSKKFAMIGVREGVVAIEDIATSMEDVRRMR